MSGLLRSKAQSGQWYSCATLGAGAMVIDTFSPAARWVSGWWRGRLSRPRHPGNILSVREVCRVRAASPLCRWRGASLQLSGPRLRRPQMRPDHLPSRRLVVVGTLIFMTPPGVIGDPHGVPRGLLWRSPCRLVTVAQFELAGLNDGCPCARHLKLAFACGLWFAAGGTCQAGGESAVRLHSAERAAGGDVLR